MKEGIGERGREWKRKKRALRLVCKGSELKLEKLKEICDHSLAQSAVANS